MHAAGAIGCVSRHVAVLLTRDRILPHGASLIANHVSVLVVDWLLNLLSGPVLLAEVPSGSEGRSMHRRISRVNFTVGTIASDLRRGMKATSLPNSLSNLTDRNVDVGSASKTDRWTTGTKLKCWTLRLW